MGFLVTEDAMGQFLEHTVLKRLNCISIASLNLFGSLVIYSAQAIDARNPHIAGYSTRVMKLVETVNNRKKRLGGYLF